VRRPRIWSSRCSRISTATAIPPSRWSTRSPSPIWLECQLTANGVDTGGPAGYQGDRVEALRAGAADWQLLLQVDSDEASGWMFGDIGRLYVCIRRQDLAELRFDRCWTVLQCY